MSGAGRQRNAVDEHVAQRAPADREIRRRVERLDHGVDERGIVGREDAEAVADRIVEAGFGQVELDVPGLLVRARLVEARARQERRFHRIVARAAGRRPAAAGAAPGSRRGHAARPAPPISSIELLEHAGGVLAARHAEVQPLFLLEEDRVGIVLAVVAALAAILLRHRRHHPPPQRPAFGELHAVGQRHGLVVPGRAVVGLAPAASPAPSRSGISPARPPRRQRRHAAVQREQAGEKAVEPGALLRGERRAFRQEGRDRRARVTLIPPPRVEHRFERVDLVAAGEGEEAFLARGAVREIGLEHALDCLRRVLAP